MAGVPGLMAAAIGLPTAAGNADNGTPTKVTQACDLLDHLSFLDFQLRESFNHKPPCDT
jgi:hypothetical protein